MMHFQRSQDPLQEPATDRGCLSRISGCSAPDQYQEVALAFARAAGLPADSTHPSPEGWRVGVCNVRGQFAAHGWLPSFNQLCSFVLAMENLGGWRALLFCELATQFGCDVVLHPIDAHNIRAPLPLPLLRT